MNRRLIRSVAVIAVLVVTIIVFARYFAGHPAVRHQLQATSPGLILGLLVLYLCTMVALALVNASTLRLCKIQAGITEILLLTAYTAVINFFGPLQSGPAVRAVYLKKKYDLNLKTYATATIVYYCFFAVFSGLFLLSALLKWWLLPLGVLSLLAVWAVSRRPAVGGRLRKLDHNWYYLAAATLLQVCLVAGIYYFELRSINHAVHVGQAIIYTGAANFALFVSITPGAIGFRESFLVFSRHLHHISNANIVAANIIDRGIYIVLLVILAVFILTTHVQRRFRVTGSQD